MIDYLSLGIYPIEFNELDKKLSANILFQINKLQMIIIILGHISPKISFL